MSWISEEYQNLDRSPRALRRFGFTVGLAAWLLGAILVWRHRGAGWPMISIGAGLVLAGALAPSMLKWVHRPWMMISFVLGWIMTGIPLTLVFFFLVTPIGLLQRLFGKRTLDAGFEADATSYWHARAATPRPEDYERQF